MCLTRSYRSLRRRICTSLLGRCGPQTRPIDILASGHWGKCTAHNRSNCARRRTAQAGGKSATDNLGPWANLQAWTELLLGPRSQQTCFTRCPWPPVWRSVRPWKKGLGWIFTQSRSFRKMEMDPTSGRTFVSPYLPQLLAVQMLTRPLHKAFAATYETTVFMPGTPLGAPWDSHDSHLRHVLPRSCYLDDHPS